MWLGGTGPDKREAHAGCEPGRMDNTGRPKRTGRAEGDLWDRAGVRTTVERFRARFARKTAASLIRVQAVVFRSLAFGKRRWDWDSNPGSREATCFQGRRNRPLCHPTTPYGSVSRQLRTVDSRPQALSSPIPKSARCADPGSHCGYGTSSPTMTNLIQPRLTDRIARRSPPAASPISA